MIAGIPWFQSALNFFLIIISIFLSCSQVFQLYHPFKGTIINLHTVTSSCVLISWPDHILSASDVELAIEKLKSHISPGTDQVPTELIRAEGSKIRCAIHKLIISVWNKEKLPEEWKQSIIVPIHKKGDKIDCNNYKGISLLPATYKSLSNILLSRLTLYVEEIIGDHQCGFRRNRSTTDHYVYSAFVIYLRKNRNTMKQCVSSL